MFATGADFCQRFDVSLFGDLVLDNGEQVSPSELATHANLLAAVADADAVVRSNLFTGARYTEDDLANLSTTAASVLRRLVCDAAMIYLKRRRGTFNTERDGAFLKEVGEAMAGLRKGETVLLGSVDDKAPAAVLELNVPDLIRVQQNSRRYPIRNYYPVSQTTQLRSE